LLKLERNYQTLRNQLNRWQQKGLIIKLKRGVYLLNENDRKINPSLYVIANQLYGPSYISLEYALNFYGLIPERVIDVTSVTTKKTMLIKNSLGNCIYQHIKPESFRGFNTKKDNAGFTFFIAEPEKAVVDWLYLNLKKITEGAKDIFGESFRFQNVEDLKKHRITELAKLFNNPKLMRVANNFCDFIKKEGGR
jgi:predicted transcriptional regulator of viral defense system